MSTVSFTISPSAASSSPAKAAPNQLNSTGAAAMMATLPRLQAQAGHIVVIKYGGSLMTDASLEETLLGNIAWLRAAGLKPIIVHGGGPAINEALRRFEREPKFVHGLRVTDEPTLEIAEMVLSGRLNKAITGRLQRFGSAAMGLSGRDGGLIKARKKVQNGLDLGRVGSVVQVDADLLKTLLEQPQQLIPVISPVCADIDLPGAALNVNADEVALAIAQALQAEQLLFMTDVPGVLADVNNPASLMATLTQETAEAAMTDGRITGGMIPKIRSAVESLQQGVGVVRILDGRIPHALLQTLLFTPEGYSACGTTILPSQSAAKTLS